MRRQLSGLVGRRSIPAFALWWPTRLAVAVVAGVAISLATFWLVQQRVLPLMEGWTDNSFLTDWLDTTVGGASGIGAALAVWRWLQRSKPDPAPSDATDSTSPEFEWPLLGGVPEQLIGRAIQLSELDRWFADPHTKLVHVYGEAGAGKTGLLAFWAERANRQHHIDVLAFDMGGFGAPESRRKASDAYRSWLARYMPPREIPADPDALRVMMLRALFGRQTLLVLDNVPGYEDVDDIRRLLPGLPDGSRVAILSRRKLDGLGTIDNAKLLHVEPLPRGDAVDLFRLRLNKESAQCDPDVRAQLIHLCAGLPLALHIAARTVVEKIAKGVPIDLELLSRSDDPHANIRFVLTWSYDALPSPDTQRAFRLLGMFPTEASSSHLHTVAALLRLSLRDTTRVLDQLESYGLVTRAADGRYGRHDMLFEFAREIASRSEHVGEVGQGLARISELYVNYVNKAFDLLNRNNPMVDASRLRKWREEDRDGVEAVSSFASPIGWFEAERTNYVYLSLCTAAGNHTPITADLAIELACSGFYFLEIGRHLDEWDRVEDAVGRYAYDSTRDRLHRARWFRNRGRRHLVDLLESRERLRSADDVLELPRARVDECRRHLERSLSLYNEEGEAQVVGDHDRSDRASAGCLTVLRELADLSRLEIDPSRPDQVMVQRAIGAYSSAQSYVAGLDRLPEESRENWTASLELALASAYMLAGAYPGYSPIKDQLTA